MPEGHTLARIAHGLRTAFADRPVRVSSPQGRFAAEAALLDRSVLTGAESAGKHLFIEFVEAQVVHVHLGLIGGFEIRSGPPPDPVGQVRLRLVGGGPRAAAYADLRGATRCQLVTPDERAAVVARLGPDPLRSDADPQRAWLRIRNRPRPIGEQLMDQQVLAGVGNVYRAEVLFRQRIHPRRTSIRRGQFQAIWADLVELMAEGVRTGRIDTVRPEHTPQAMGRDPRVDDHGGEVYVYRRHGQPCLVCGSLVCTELLAGRKSYWCPRCQRAPRALG